MRKIKERKTNEKNQKKENHEQKIMDRKSWTEK